ncbi:type II membrane protein [Maublancomyces gigas]|uniref:Autophagy-related protein 27 n=1 Tax=Discina gigas TaxID=1032678 RepID=A0ABR3GW45_9PEZI
MRFARHLPSLLLLVPPALVVASFNCQTTQDGVQFDLRALRGSHSVVIPSSTEDPVVSVNRTWTINPCFPIEREKDSPLEEQCPEGTRVCGIEQVSLNHGAPTIYVIPIAGDIDGRHTDEELKRLKTSDAVAGKEGLRLTLNGGLYDKVKQQAVVEFICDLDRTGLEGEKGEKETEKRETETETETETEKSLKFVSYDTDDKELHVLRLEWKTKYACEVVASDPPPDQGSSSWGFFTWFIIILFLGVAAYLIFRSWLAYNRYGASWDILPHSDTIRDIPYLLKDWSRRVIGTLQGGGARGGYSAV